VQVEAVLQVDLKQKKITSNNYSFVISTVNNKCKFDYCYSEEEVADEQEPEGEDLNSEDVCFDVLVCYLK